MDERVFAPAALAVDGPTFLSRAWALASGRSPYTLASPERGGGAKGPERNKVGGKEGKSPYRRRGPKRTGRNIEARALRSAEASGASH